MEHLATLARASLMAHQCIQAGQGAQNHKDNCRRLIDRVRLLVPLMDDVRKAEITSSLAAAVAFERLEQALSKARDLINACGKAAGRVYMVVRAVAILNQFQDVNLELYRCLNAIPPVLLRTPDNIRAQVARLSSEFRSVRYAIDAGTRQISSEVELLVMEHRKGVRGNHDVRSKIREQLGIHTPDAVKAEISTVDRARSFARSEKDKVQEEYLTQIMAILWAMMADVTGAQNNAETGGGKAGNNSAEPKLKVPTEYCCPLSLEIMTDPVIIASGQTYERVFIERWLDQGHSSCPITRCNLSHTALIPNFALKSSISAWCRANRLPPPQPRRLPPNATVRGPGLIEIRPAGSPQWATAGTNGAKESSKVESDGNTWPAPPSPGNASSGSTANRAVGGSAQPMRRAMSLRSTPSRTGGGTGVRVNGSGSLLPAVIESSEERTLAAGTEEWSVLARRPLSGSFATGHVAPGGNVSRGGASAVGGKAESLTPRGGTSILPTSGERSAAVSVPAQAWGGLVHMATSTREVAPSAVSAGSSPPPQLKAVDEGVVKFSPGVAVGTVLAKAKDETPVNGTGEERVAEATTSCPAPDASPSKPEAAFTVVLTAQSTTGTSAPMAEEKASVQVLSPSIQELPENVEEVKMTKEDIDADSKLASSPFSAFITPKKLEPVGLNTPVTSYSPLTLFKETPLAASTATRPFEVPSSTESSPAGYLDRPLSPDSPRSMGYSSSTGVASTSSSASNTPPSVILPTSSSAGAAVRAATERPITAESRSKSDSGILSPRSAEMPKAMIAYSPAMIEAVMGGGSGQLKVSSSSCSIISSVSKKCVTHEAPSPQSSSGSAQMSTEREESSPGWSAGGSGARWAKRTSSVSSLSPSSETEQRNEQQLQLQVQQQGQQPQWQQQPRLEGDGQRLMEKLSDKASSVVAPLAASANILPSSLINTSPDSPKNFSAIVSSSPPKLLSTVTSTSGGLKLERPASFSLSSDKSISSDLLRASSVGGLHMPPSTTSPLLHSSSPVSSTSSSSSDFKSGGTPLSRFLPHSVSLPSPAPSREFFSPSHVVSTADVEGLITALSHGGTEEKREAANTVRQLTKSSGANRAFFGQTPGALAALVYLLSSPMKEVACAAVFAVLNLSICDSNKPRLLSLGVIDRLVILLQRGTENAREGAIATLFSMSLLDESKLAIGQAGALPLMVDVLVSGTRRAKEDAVSALFNVSLYPPNKRLVVLAGAVKPLTYMVRKGAGVFGEMVVEKALAVVGNVASMVEGRNAIVAARGIPLLCQLLEPNNKAKMQEDAVACLLRLCVSSEAWKSQMWEEQIEAALRRLAVQGTERGRAKATALLEQFGCEL
eukprot:TRINITY_DN3988_c0_g4_i1.p1 TRINITY_DN3988_c0_g4~~TRINITY_DN3988_c0_g4_i1.p1  ORF type:complete len:1349 (+),score=248.11 TRINITY_DN3988_c0_g4_i1:576-4622(+)